MNMNTDIFSSSSSTSSSSSSSVQKNCTPGADGGHSADAAATQGGASVQCLTPFSDIYRRNNKRNGQKHLRCFPSCKHTGHEARKICASSIDVAALVEAPASGASAADAFADAAFADAPLGANPAANSLRCVGELMTVAGELAGQCLPALRVGAIIYPSQLEAELNWSPVTGLSGGMGMGMGAGNIAVSASAAASAADGAGQQPPPPAEVRRGDPGRSILHEGVIHPSAIEEGGVSQAHFRFEPRNWTYNWKSNRNGPKIQHCAVFYLLRPATHDEAAAAAAVTHASQGETGHAAQQQARSSRPQQRNLLLPGPRQRTERPLVCVASCQGQPFRIGSTRRTYAGTTTGANGAQSLHVMRRSRNDEIGRRTAPPPPPPPPPPASPVASLSDLFEDVNAFLEHPSSMQMQMQMQMTMLPSDLTAPLAPSAFAPQGHTMTRRRVSGESRKRCDENSDSDAGAGGLPSAKSAKRVSPSPSDSPDVSSPEDSSRACIWDTVQPPSPPAAAATTWPLPGPAVSFSSRSSWSSSSRASSMDGGSSESDTDESTTSTSSGSSGSSESSGSSGSRTSFESFESFSSSVDYEDGSSSDTQSGMDDEISVLLQSGWGNEEGSEGHDDDFSFDDRGVVLKDRSRVAQLRSGTAFIGGGRGSASSASPASAFFAPPSSSFSSSSSSSHIAYSAMGPDEFDLEFQRQWMGGGLFL